MNVDVKGQEVMSGAQRAGAAALPGLRRGRLEVCTPAAPLRRARHGVPGLVELLRRLSPA